MDPARWREIERLYHAALSRPVEARAAFLADACGSDARLREEVASLLAEPVSAEEFLARPPVAAVADPDSTAAPHAGFQQLRTLGPYRIERLLGRGGMGEVYRARDLKLGRDVAIKILPQPFAGDRDRLSRFEREARVLAALNHPHIAAIYGFEEDAGVRGLVLELVEGPTLAERIEPSGLPLRERLSSHRRLRTRSWRRTPKASSIGTSSRPTSRSPPPA